MKKNASQKDNSNVDNAKIVDGKLILSLPNAQMPVVWQMDLEKTESASFTVIEDKKAKAFVLVLKGHDGKVDEIAPYDEKQNAVDILMETSSVLQNAHGQIKPGSAANSNTAAANQKDSDKLGAGLAAALVVVLILIWVFVAAAPQTAPGTSVASGDTSAPAALGNSSSRQSSGVPVSADDFLNNR